MSNSHAIAAVTSCLQQIVAGAFDGRVEVTTKPLDRPAAAGSARRVNLFLYSIVPNAASPDCTAAATDLSWSSNHRTLGAEK